MLLKIDYDYEISYIPYRHQNKNYAWGRSEVEVEIRELNFSEAPLVARVGQKSDFAKNQVNFKYKKNGDLRDIRFHDDRFYIEIYDLETFKKNIEKDYKETLFYENKPIKKIPATNNPNGVRVTPTTGLVITQSARYDQPHREVNDDMGEEKANDYKEMANQIIIIGDVVYREIAEPIYSTEHDYRGENLLTVKRKSDFASKVRNYIYSDYDYCRGMTGNLNWAAEYIKSSKGVDVPQIEIFDPSVFTYDGDSKDLMRIADNINQVLKSQKFAKLPRKVLELSIEFREAYENADPCITDRLVASVQALNNLEIDDSDNENINNIYNIAQAKVAGSHNSYNNHDFRNSRAFQRKEFLNDGMDKFKGLTQKFVDRWELRNQEDLWKIEASPISNVNINGVDHIELGSKGHVVECCHLAGLTTEDALKIIGSGDRVLTSSAFKGSRSIATVDKFDNVTVFASAVDSSNVLEGFEEFIKITNALKIEENKLLELDTIDMDFGV